MKRFIVVLLSLSVLLTTFAACEKENTVYCIEEPATGNYESLSATATSLVELTKGTAEGEYLLLLQQGNTSATVTATWEAASQQLYIAPQDFGSVEVQIQGQLSLKDKQLRGTLTTNQANTAPISIQHQQH